MSARIAVVAIALFAIALVLAQDVAPATPLYHTWQYALALFIALAVVVFYANGARRGDDGAVGRRLLVALAGAAIVDVAGLASGLLGPDTASIIGTPGTVTPILTLGAAAFFAPADADAIARGASGITLRRRSAPEIALAPGNRRVVGDSLLYLDPRPAAFVDVFDEHRKHLTVTQPSNTSFLSPVLLFRDHQRIGTLDVPFDTFAAPARHVSVHALYFTPSDLAQFGHASAPGLDRTRPALVLTAADEDGHPLGITLAGSGQTVILGPVHVRVTIGSYPALAVAAAPPTWALILGCVLFVAGLAWSVLTPRGGLRAATAHPPQPQGA
ncbi:MAG: hypothetical protein JO225_15235 [Candidatus Eremiobacteraeota bacterium]|nr:hypothetical protein [Candidatus Eremiobacteraeota bacterium]